MIWWVGWIHIHLYLFA